MNLVEKANKVMTFRKYIREECRKKGLEYPSDEKISQYINGKYGMNVADFMADYKEREGIFREPISDFCKELEKYEFGDNKPTLEEVKEWTEKNGYDVSLFLRERTIKSMKPFYRKTIERALKLNESTLVKLWNWFIQESGCYGKDSHIFDLANPRDCDWLLNHISKRDLSYIVGLVDVRYVQVLSKEGEPKDYIHVVKSIKGTIVAYWEDMVDSIMSFGGLCYDFDKYEAQDYSQSVMNNVFQPVIREMCDVPYKERNV